MRLTQAQIDAIQHPLENLQLIACAGSGKTEVVARRVAHLLTPTPGPNLVPANIVAFTFTEKAAAELKDRIHSRCREIHGERHGMAEMYVGTIHGFALNLLKSHVPKYSKHEVLNEVQQYLFVDRNSKKVGLTTSTTLDGKPLKRYTDTDKFIGAHSIIRESVVDQAALQGNSVAESMGAYLGELDRLDYLDYSSILSECVKTLESDGALRVRLGEDIKYVIVDEYQDVNPIQERLVRLLHDAGAKLCVVGDDDQTIYQWRGGDVKNILTFATRYPRVATLKLEDNYRSSRGIVETAQRFIEQNTHRLPKAMKSTAAQSDEVGDVVALGFDSDAEEAVYIAQKLKSMIGLSIKEGDHERGITWSDMAVLLRSVKANGAPITQALKDADVPFIVVGMADLFGTAEAQAARQSFYFMADRADAEHVRNAWKEARLGLRPDEIDAGIALLEKSRRSLEDSDQKRWGLYSIQRLFIELLEKMGVREERIPDNRGEVVFYNLGKFSQAISDFETINFKSGPKNKYESFAGFLQYGAEGSYGEGWQDNAYANPNAVKVMTVHQAKGMQWPVVFVPALLRNRFPAAAPPGRTVWHLIPAAAVKDQERFKGGLEDERRLFYVALTRAQKYLHLTWGPKPGNSRAQRASEFFENIQASKWVKRAEPDYTKRKKLEPTARREISNVVFSFSNLKYFFECPYQFKLRVLYGFNPPLHEALGYGKALHDALAEVHSRVIRGEKIDESMAPELARRHLHVPYAYPSLQETLLASAEKVVREYLRANSKDFDKVEFAEKQIEITLGNGVSVTGRIDLVRRTDTDEVTVVDLKSSEQSQEEALTESQLHIYALGYLELTGRRPDYVEIYELDKGARKPRSVDDDFIDKVVHDVGRAADTLRDNRFEAQPKEERCGACDLCGICSSSKASRA